MSTAEAAARDEGARIIVAGRGGSGAGEAERGYLHHMACDVVREARIGEETGAEVTRMLAEIQEAVTTELVPGGRRLARPRRRYRRICV